MLRYPKEKTAAFPLLLAEIPGNRAQKWESEFSENLMLKPGETDRLL
jgi:hypothetical protein